MKKLYLALVASIAFLFSAFEILAVAGTWTVTGSLNYARSYHAAVSLTNGKVLVVGGLLDSSGYRLSSAELYDPSTGTWTTTGSMNNARGWHTVTLLPNGKVLVAGGHNLSSGYLSSAEIYDPGTGTWTPTGSLNYARCYHAATLLPNGKVLVAGGDSSAGALSSTEIYDPSTGTWTVTGSLNIARMAEAPIILLPDGKALIAGGAGCGAYCYHPSAELYDPSTGTWTVTGSMNVGRYTHGVILLPNGKVLAAGGSSGITSAELYDPATGNWTVTGALSTGRFYIHQAFVLLPNGKVLVAGGSKNDGSINRSLSSTELYDPSNGTWTTTGSLNIARGIQHTLTLLQNGKVLAVGGSDGISTVFASAELYDPGVTTLSVSTFTKLGTEDTDLTFSSLDFTSHFSSGSLTKIKITKLPSNGILRLSGNNVAIDQEIPIGSLANLKYVPLSDWHGTDSFGWNGSNGTQYAVISADVNITIASSYPLVSTITKSGYEDSPITFSATDFTSHFSGLPCDKLKMIKITSLPAHGTLKLAETNVEANKEISVAALGNLKFVPNAAWDGNTSFAWNGSNGTKYALNAASVNITIHAIAEPPTLTSISKAGSEDTELTFSASDFTNHFSDPLGVSLTKIQILSLPEHGTLKLSGTNVIVNQEITVDNLGKLKFVPDADWNGTTSFSWNGSNGALYASTAADVTITIAPILLTPTVNNITKTGIPNTSLELSAADFTSSFIGVGNGGLSKIKIISLPDYGKLKLLGVDVALNQEIETANLDYLNYIPPENGWAGNTSFLWKGMDNTNYSTNVAEVDITIASPSTAVWWTQSWVMPTAVGIGTTAVATISSYLGYKYCHFFRKPTSSVRTNNDPSIEMQPVEGKSASLGEIPVTGAPANQYAPVILPVEGLSTPAYQPAPAIGEVGEL